MEQKTIEKNSTYLTKGNHYIDDLLYKIESLSLLSEKFCFKIQQTCLWILQQGSNPTNKAQITAEIKRIYDLMKAIKIFDMAFVEDVNYLMQHGLVYELTKND